MTAGEENGWGGQIRGKHLAKGKKTVKNLNRIEKPETSLRGIGGKRKTEEEEY